MGYFWENKKDLEVAEKDGNCTYILGLTIPRDKD